MDRIWIRVNRKSYAEGLQDGGEGRHAITKFKFRIGITLKVDLKNREATLRGTK